MAWILISIRLRRISGGFGKMGKGGVTMLGMGVTKLIGGVRKIRIKAQEILRLMGLVGG